MRAGGAVPEEASAGSWGGLQSAAPICIHAPARLLGLQGRRSGLAPNVVAPSQAVAVASPQEGLSGSPVRGCHLSCGNDLPSACVQLLGLKGRESYLDPHILAAYEALAGANPEEGFSEGAAEGRAFLLQAAADELRRSRGRTPPGEPRGIYVEWALLPGALALLQEARPRWQRSHLHCLHGVRRDTLLARHSRAWAWPQPMGC